MRTPDLNGGTGASAGPWSPPRPRHGAHPPGLRRQDRERPRCPVASPLKQPDGRRTWSASYRSPTSCRVTLPPCWSPARATRSPWPRPPVALPSPVGRLPKRCGGRGCRLCWGIALTWANSPAVFDAPVKEDGPPTRLQFPVARILQGNGDGNPLHRCGPDRRTGRVHIAAQMSARVCLPDQALTGVPSIAEACCIGLRMPRGAALGTTRQVKPS